MSRRVGFSLTLVAAGLFAGALVAQTARPSASSPAPLLPVRSLADAPPPAEKSPRPKPGEWKDGTPVRLHRTSARASRCETRLVREWLRMRCEQQVAAVSQLGGTVDDVAAFTWQDAKDPRIVGGELVFPLRRGDRRAIQVWTFEPGYDGPLTVTADFVVQEDWLDGPAPIVIAL